MTDITDYIPRTMRHNEIKNKDIERADISNDIDQFLANGGEILDLDKRSKKEKEASHQASYDRWSTKWNKDGMPLSDKEPKVFRSKK